jgi:hypothetical protein
LKVAPCLLAFLLGHGASGLAEWRYLENDHLRVGINLAAGGSIGWLSEAGSTRNVLNAYDEGRYVQQSYYGDEDGSDWNGKPWRYNPVQGGSWKGVPAEVIQHEVTPEQMTVKTQPRHWATGERIEEMVMEETVTLKGEVVLVHFSMIYRGAKVHAPRHQELPAVFVQPELDRLMFCERGSPPWTGAALVTRQPGFPNETIQFAESWCAWVDAEGWGVGVCFPHSTEATCYRFRGGGKSDCSYVAPVQTFALKPDLKFDYSVALTLGSVEAIRGKFLKLCEAKKQPVAE